MNDAELTECEETLAAAELIVDDLISRLPDELRLEALRIGYELRMCHPDDPDLLGEYVRLADLIILYLDAIRSRCETDGFSYERELERTYLHEFGHHLGLGEAAVERLGV